MYELRTEIEISASAEAVWDILLDLPRHAEWNPFIRSISGEPAPGGTLKVTICPPGGKPMGFSPRVLAAEPGRELRGLGRVLLPGLFDGEHYFLLEPAGEGRVRLVHGERFSGLLLPLLKRSLETGTRAGFEAMSQALKARAEAAAV